MIKLNKQKTIQKIYSFFLLLVFSLSSLPKIYFHDVIANHKDVVSHCDHPQKVKACLHQATYNCHVEDLVVNATYLIFTNLPQICLTGLFVDYQASYRFFSPRNELLNKESRGPPSMLAFG